MGDINDDPKANMASGDTDTKLASLDKQESNNGPAKNDDKHMQTPECHSDNDDSDVDNMDATAQELLEIPSGLKLWDKKKAKKRQRKVWKNVIVLSLGFVFLFSATNGLALLQSSLNAEVGIFGLVANFGSVVFSCMFIAPSLIQLIGCKWSIVASMCCFLLWMAANLYPVWGTLIPASVLMGLGCGPLWTAQCTYFTLTGVAYANKEDLMPDSIISKFFGIFFMAFMTSPVWGNVISSSILMLQLDPSNATNVTEEEIYTEEVFSLCGRNYCPNREHQANVTNENLTGPDKRLVYMLVSLYMALCIIGIVIIVVFLDKIKLSKAEEEEKEKLSPVQLLSATFRQMGQRNLLLLVPLTMYVGMQQAFMVAEFTLGFITCTLGVDKVGIVIICYGATAAIVSVSSGQLVKKTGRPALFIFGGVMQLIALVVFLTWTPHPDEIYVFLILPGLWGCGDAIWQTQMNSLFSTLFMDTSEAAFSNYRLWEALGFIIALSYSSFVCMQIKIYMVMVLLVLGFTGYITVEVLLHREKQAKKDEDIVDGEEEEPEDVVMAPLANMLRRKSSIYIPQKTVNEAASIIRRKSTIRLGPNAAERFTKRRLTAFVPAASAIRAVTPDVSPASSRNPSPLPKKKSVRLADGPAVIMGSNRSLVQQQPSVIEEEPETATETTNQEQPLVKGEESKLDVTTN